MTDTTEITKLNEQIAELTAKKAALVQQIVVKIATEIEEIQKRLENIRSLRDFAEINVDLSDVTVLADEIISDNPENTWDSSRC